MERRLTVIFVAAAALALLAVGSVQAQLLVENFDYTPGDLITDHGWVHEGWTDGTLFVTDDYKGEEQYDGSHHLGEGSGWAGYERMHYQSKSITETEIGPKGIMLQYDYTMPDDPWWSLTPATENEFGAGVTIRASEDTQYRWDIGVQAQNHGGGSGTGDILFRCAYGKDGDFPSVISPLALSAGTVLTLRLEVYENRTRGYVGYAGDPGSTLMLFDGPTDDTPAGKGVDHVRVGMYNRSPKAKLDNIYVGVIPEPGSMAALAMGLTGLVGFAIRRRR